jgi:hypothetical protein
LPNLPFTIFSGNGGSKFRKKFKKFPETIDSGSRPRVFACYILDLCPENPRNPRSQTWRTLIDPIVLVVIAVVRLLFSPPATHCRSLNNAADSPDALNIAGVHQAVAELRDGSTDIRRAVPQPSAPVKSCQRG